MGAVISFCPGCWSEAGPEAAECPHCGYRIADFAALPYESKLILALKHPIRENRMLAIQLLGELKCAAAVPALETILREEQDPYVLGAIARAVARIDTHASNVILSRLRSHRSAIVRDFAEEAWRELTSGESRSTLGEACDGTAHERSGS